MPLTHTPTKHHVDLWGGNRGQAKEGPGKESNELSEEIQTGEAGTHTLCFSGKKVGATCLLSSQFQPDSYIAEHPISLSL